MKELAKQTLHLDAEGYPIMSGGIRANDPEFLKQVFQNLGRYQNDDKFSLSTKLDGREVLLSSFDDPLVAQGIEIGTSSCVWKFLGDLSIEVPITELRVDEWNRLHSYVGAARLPAVMSHKVQSAFLQSYPNLKSLHPKPFRSTQDPLDSKRWDKPYQVNEMPWDMGGVNPVIEFHSKEMLKRSGETFLIPGAGTAHEAAFLEEHGKKVTALDFSPTAKDVFKKHYPNSATIYIVGDFFTEKLPEFEAILELAFFVALDPSLRSKIVTRIHSLLKPGGYWGGCFFTRYSEAGPPFGLSEWELQQNIREYFEIIEWERSSHSHKRRQNVELWALLRKK